MKQIFILVSLWIFSMGVFAQGPIIEGDDLLCPEGTGIVRVADDFDSYQWYRRYFGSGESVLLSGATDRELQMDFYDFAASFLSVVVTLGGEELTSPEFFVDGYAFLPAVVIIEGNYTIGEEGVSVLCPGDTMTFTLGLPYTERIVWYKDGVPMEGEVNRTLIVTEPGVYTVEGAPEVCPDFIQNPGVPLVVESCSSTSVINESIHSTMKVYPNPSDGLFFIERDEVVSDGFEIWDFKGKVVHTGQLVDSFTQLDITSLPPGVYLLKRSQGHEVVRLVKQ